MIAKAKTAIRLLARGEWRAFARALRLLPRRLRVQFAGGRPFRHHRMGFPFVCFPHAPESMDLYVEGTIDELELALVRDWVEPGDAVVDVGANVGLFAAAAAPAAGPAGRLLAIEASPLLAGLLEDLARRLNVSNLQVAAVVAGAQAGGRTRFHEALPGRHTGRQSVVIDPQQRGDYREISMPTDTLDSICRTILPSTNPIALVKIDIEGGEPLALRGATGLLAGQDQPLWLVEINPWALRSLQFTPADVVAFFPEKTFERWLSPKGSLHPATPSRTRLLTSDESFTDVWFYNLVALPRAGRFAPRTRRARSRLQAG